MLPDNDIWCHTVLAVVEEHNPVERRQHEFDIISPLEFRRSRTFLQDP